MTEGRYPPSPDAVPRQAPLRNRGAFDFSIARNSSGSLAILAAIRRASSWTSTIGLAGLVYSSDVPVAEPPHFQKISTHERKIAFVAKQTARK